MSRLLADPALVVGIVRAVLILLISFGVGITQPQLENTLTLVGLLLAAVSLALTGVTRETTTPVAAPSLPAGTLVKVITPAGEPDRTATL